MDENKFWLTVWSLVAACFCTLVVSITVAHVSKSYVLREMVEVHKVDPMRAACALDIGERKDGVCALMAAK